nr:PREDICTED: coiled-coil domain-containing protein 110-like [Latimeria chalumnae]|eukprot:XP_014344611.1 PREDICTED: coiled-coil domain-containing protein 110-like [Latimeria chalumnae]
MSSCTESPVKDNHFVSTVAMESRDELWHMLDNISSTGERLQQELKKSHKREIVLAKELQALKDTLGATVLTDDGYKMENPLASQNQSQELIVMKGPWKTDHKQVNRIYELKLQVERMQNAMLSLEEANLNLHNQLTHEDSSKRCDLLTHALTTTLQVENQKLREAIVKLEKQKKLDELKSENLRQTAEETSGSTMAPSYLATEDGNIKEELHDKGKQISELENSMQEKMVDLEKKQQDKIYMLEEQLQLKTGELKTLQECLSTLKQDNQRLVEELKLREKEVVDKEIFETLEQEFSKTKEKNNDLEKKNNILKDKLSQAENNSRACIKELKHLMGKYSDLKNYIRDLEKERCQNLTEKQSIIGLLDKLNDEKHKLCNDYNLLKGDKETQSKLLENVKEELNSLRQDTHRIIEEKLTLEKIISKLQEKIQDLTEKLQNANIYIERARKLASDKDSEKEMLLLKLQEEKDINMELDRKINQYIVDKEAMGFQIEHTLSEKDRLEKEFQEQLKQSQCEHQATEKAMKNLRRECEALSKMVADLKEDKRLLKTELQEIVQEKHFFEAQSQRLCEESGKLKDSAKILERERDILKNELDEMHKDYLNLSDRITDRLNVLYRNSQEACQMPSKELTDCEDSVEMRMNQQKTLDTACYEDAKKNTIDIRRRVEEEEKATAGPYSSHEVSPPSSVMKTADGADKQSRRVIFS